MIQQKNYINKIINCKQKVVQAAIIIFLNCKIFNKHLNFHLAYCDLFQPPSNMQTAPKMPIQEVGKVQFEYQTPCTKSKFS